MTDRVSALTVVLEHDIRVDDIEPLLTAIRQLRGVLSVRTEVISGLDIHIAESRVRTRVIKGIFDLVDPPKP